MVPPSDQEEPALRRGRARDQVPQSAPAEVLTFAVGASWLAASIARERVAGWLAAHGWPSGQADDLVLAVNEAVSNSVEHGYAVPRDVVDHPGTVEVTTRLVRIDSRWREVELVVSDGGRWVDPDGVTTFRGHGMVIMRACSSEFRITGTGRGTTVVLRSLRAPLPLRPA